MGVSGAGARRKGGQYERELCQQLSEELGTAVARNLSQTRDGGNDISLRRENGTKFRIEAKRRAKIGNIYEWMEQAKNSCSIGDMPVVVCRADGKKSLAIIDFDDLIYFIRGDC